MTNFLWICAIHGKNAEIIHLLEELEVELNDETYSICLKEAIKCHHNDIANYIALNLLNKIDDNEISFAFRYHNFEFFPNDITKDSIIFYACKNSFEY